MFEGQDEQDSNVDFVIDDTGNYMAFIAFLLSVGAVGCFCWWMFNGLGEAVRTYFNVTQ